MVGAVVCLVGAVMCVVGAAVYLVGAVIKTVSSISSLINSDFTISFLILILPYFSDSVHLLIPVGRKTLLFLAWEWRRS